MRQKKQANFPNYDDSAFDAVTPLLKGDEKALSAVMNDVKSLQAIIAPDQFKSYEELQKKLDKTMGFDTKTYMTPTDAPDDAPTPTPTPAPRQTRTEKPAAAAWVPPVVTDDKEDNDDVDLSRFTDDE